MFWGVLIKIMKVSVTVNFDYKIKCASHVTKARKILFVHYLIGKAY